VKQKGNRGDCRLECLTPSNFSGEEIATIGVGQPPDPMCTAIEREIEEFVVPALKERRLR
jgi:hypothetical protein